MAEADAAAIARGRLFCDSRETTVGHVGEVPASLGPRIVADHYEPERMRRGSPEEITIFKNGGGAHLDLMVARHILDAWRA
jgi:ornithine cyclodeaminase/alanine dehydrogenase-like protein (mu-crystallin family)